MILPEINRESTVVLAACSDGTTDPYDTGLGLWPLLGILELKICDTLDLHTGI